MSPNDVPLPKFRANHVLLWSPRQQCFHRETVEEMLRENWDAFFYQSYHDSDWIVVAFTDTPEEAAELQRKMLESFDTPAPGEPYVPPPDI